MQNDFIGFDVNSWYIKILYTMRYGFMGAIWIHQVYFSWKIWAYGMEDRFHITCTEK